MTQYAYQQDAYMVGTTHGSGPRRSLTLTAAVDLPIGSAVKRDVNDRRKVVLWTNTGAYANVRIAGFVGRNAEVFSDYQENEYNVKAGQNALVWQEETISLIVGVDVKGGELAYCDAVTGVPTNIAAGNGTPIGSFKTDGTAGSTILIILNIL